MTETAMRKERVLRKVSGLIVLATFRRVDVYYAGSTTSDPGPLVTTSNHFGGFLDPLLAMYALPRRPRFIARDVIWKVPIAGSLMRWLDAIPVHKAEDTGPGDNQQMFQSCYDSLARGEHILIFPEGITRDEPSIGKYKTGTARIALGARLTGVGGLSIVPFGIHYEDKAALRSRVSVIVAEALDLDVSVDGLAIGSGETGPDNREAVTALTSDLDRRLRQAAPDFGDWREALTLTFAAEVTLRSIGEPEEPVSLSQRDRLAGVLGSLPETGRTEIRDQVEAYQGSLDTYSLTDRHVATERSAVRMPGWARIILGIFLLPYALIGFLLHFVPFLIVKAVGLARLSPAAMASLKPIVAIFAFGATWGLATWAVLQELGWIAAAAALLVMPLYGLSTVVLWEQVALWGRTRRRLRRSATDQGWFRALRRERESLVARVVEST